MSATGQHIESSKAFPWLAADPRDTEARRLAKDLLNSINFEAERRCAEHRQLYSCLWRCGGATPEEIVSAMGSDGARWRLFALEQMRHMEAMAAIAGVRRSDWVADQDFIPPRHLDPQPDGTLKLGRQYGT